MTYELSEWDLSKIQPQNIEQEFKQLEQQANELEKKRELLTDNITPDQFMQILKEFEQFRIHTHKLSSYAGLKTCEDSSNQEARALESQVETFLTKIQNKLLFFNLWIKELPEEKAQELIKASGSYHYFLESIRKTKQYALKENEEKIINIKDTTGVSALNSIYDTLTSQFEYEFQGEAVTQNELIVAVRNKNPKVREEAYLALLTKFKKYKDVLGEIYKNVINDWREECITLRGYKSPIAVRNTANDIPDEAIEVLLKVCQKNQSLFHEFFELKRKKLGLEKLRRFDLYAPLEEEKANIPYNEAVEMVLETFKQFSPKFHEEALNIINANNIHSRPQKNKRTGAFCASVTAKLNPYVLLSYKGTLRDVSTLAHELGHGIHHNLARDNTEFTAHSALPLAETASIFSEMVLSENLLKKYPEQAKEMIFSKLDDLYASIIRQAGFVSFEKKAHQMMEEGKTIQEMSEEYLKDLKAQLGPNVEVDDVFAYEWCYIPHIYHTPFYCYAYAFGNLLTLSLYETYKEQGPEFANKVVELLAKGGSDSPVNLTKAIGVDITSEEFWQKGFDMIKEMIEKVRE